MRPRPAPDYLAGYPAPLVEQVRTLIDQDQLAPRLMAKYPEAHAVRTDKALYDYVMEIKGRYLRNAAPVNKVLFDSKLHVIKHALGTHTRISRVQGSRLKASNEIRVASVFRDVPREFLRMIVVHELAHLREGEHDKAFYQLCCHMEPDYHQLEFDLRVYLSHLAASRQPLWTNPGSEAR